MNEEEVQPLATFDLDSIALEDKLDQVHQEGNYLVGVTPNGVRFRHRLKPDQMLAEVDGKMKIVKMRVSAG
jgi:hypothetical protein